MMETLKIILWILIGVVFYAYLGYGIVLFILVKLKKLFRIGKKSKEARVIPDYEPEVTLFVAAYNEKDYVDAKVANSFEMEYPKEKM